MLVLTKLNKGLSKKAIMVYISNTYLKHLCKSERKGIDSN